MLHVFLKYAHIIYAFMQSMRDQNKLYVFWTRALYTIHEIFVSRVPCIVPIHENT